MIPNRHGLVTTTPRQRAALVTAQPLNHPYFPTTPLEESDVGVAYLPVWT